MADTGVKYAATVTEGSGGSEAWDSGTLDVAALNSVGSDYALLTGANFDKFSLGNPVYCSNFSMGVPAGSTITGIKVEISVTNEATAEGVWDNVLQLSKVAGTGVGDNQASTTPYSTSGYATRTYGGDGQLWGTTWSLAEVNATGFGVVYQPISNSPNEDMGLDFIRITVYYLSDFVSISWIETDIAM